MAVTLTDKITGQAQGVITLAAGDVLTVQKNGTPDTNYTITCPAGATLTVTVAVKARSP